MDTLVELLLYNINYFKEQSMVSNTKAQALKHIYQIINKVKNYLSFYNNVLGVN